MIFYFHILLLLGFLIVQKVLLKFNNESSPLIICLLFVVGGFANLKLTDIKVGIHEDNLLYKKYYESLKLSLFHEHRLVSMVQTANSDSYSTLKNYPKRKLEFDGREAPQNIIFIIIESWRKDFFSSEVTPNIYQFSQNAINLKNHYSSSNNTRFGLFGLYYGLHPSLWWKFLSEEKGPLLIDELIKMNFQPFVFSSVNIQRPEFYKTVFKDIPANNKIIYKKIPMDQRDALAIKHTKNLLMSNKDKKFISILLNSSHFPYRYPESELEYPIISSIKDKTVFLKRYNKSLKFLDSLIGDLIDFLIQNSYFENSIIMIAGDHGESFGENNIWGHSNSFSQEQINTPLLIHFPGLKAKEIINNTIHGQIPTTMFDFLGIKNNYKDYAHYPSILSHNKLSFLSVCDWDYCCIQTENRKLIFTNGNYNNKKSWFELRDQNYNLLKLSIDEKKSLLPFYFQYNRDVLNF